MTKKLYEKGLEEYPLRTVIGQNLFFVIYFGLGIIGIWNLKVIEIPIASILYSLFIIILRVFALRKHIFPHCSHYGKRFSTGSGTSAALMLAKDSAHDELGVKLAGITWGVATIAPIIGMIAVLIFNFEVYLLAIFILFILLTPLNLAMHKRSCFKCKMRDICPASMAQTKRDEDLRSL